MFRILRIILLWVFLCFCVKGYLSWPTVVIETSQLCEFMKQTEKDGNFGAQCSSCRAIFINDTILHAYFDDCFEEVRLCVLVHEYTHFFFSLFPLHEWWLTNGDKDEYVVQKIETCFADLWFGRNIKAIRFEAWEWIKNAQKEETNQ